MISRSKKFAAMPASTTMCCALRPQEGWPGRRVERPHAARIVAKCDRVHDALQLRLGGRALVAKPGNLVLMLHVANMDLGAGQQLGGAFAPLRRVDDINDARPGRRE